MVIILNLSFEREGEGGLNLSFEWGGEWGGGGVVQSAFLHVLAGMFWAFSRSAGGKRPQNNTAGYAPGCQ